MLTYLTPLLTKKFVVLHKDILFRYRKLKYW